MTKIKLKSKDKEQKSVMQPNTDMKDDLKTMKKAFKKM